jgi:hypothetical protein
MLNDFFRINLPYGIQKNEKGEWMAFNREYEPLGFNERNFSFPESTNLSKDDLPIFTKYKNVTEKKLLEIGKSDDPESIYRNNKGEIYRVYLYNDATNPVNQMKDVPELWERYFYKIKLLSKLCIR